MADRHYRSLPTRRTRLDQLSAFFGNLRRVQISLAAQDLQGTLIAGALLQRVAGKNDIAQASDYDRAKADIRESLRFLERSLAEYEEIAAFSARYLELVPESDDERIARKPAAKPALRALSSAILRFWTLSLKREINFGPQSKLVTFARALFTLAGDDGVTISTTVQRLKAVPPSSSAVYR